MSGRTPGRREGGSGLWVKVEGLGERKFNLRPAGHYIFACRLIRESTEINYRRASVVIIKGVVRGVLFKIISGAFRSYLDEDFTDPYHAGNSKGKRFRGKEYSFNSRWQ